jgi:hypothetical protein
LCGTWTPEWLLWQGPEVIVRVNYKPILSSERAPHSKKPAIDKQKTKIWPRASNGSPTPRLPTVGCNLTSVSASVESSRGYSWATLFLGEINTRTWISRLGEYQK